ncbi:hypothetical protein DPMN_115070 [Dreissena polymorpha]|uniref:Uncharacterized protein n=1 Tax=Dreissena polymorpha TaxID=45954 RepID=A0A9D4KL79_DREPO|nr:hypothetical protein DPMN_115070 [Dreissena polymorpha]
MTSKHRNSISLIIKKDGVWSADLMIQQDTHVTASTIFSCQGVQYDSLRVMVVRDSDETNIRTVWMRHTGRRWSANKAVDQADCRLKQKLIGGISCSGREERGSF